MGDISLELINKLLNLELEIEMNMEITKLPISKLEATSLSIRRSVLDMVAPLGRGYLQQGLGAADLFTLLFFDELRIESDNLNRPDRDRFILSTAHNSAVYYATLAERGFLDKDRLVEYTTDESDLEINVSEKASPLVEATCGSLGQGLSVAVGFALAAKRQGKVSRVYVLLGDAEMQEGQVWEAAMSAASHKLDNLCVIVDVNGMQAEGPMEKITEVHPIADKWKAFGWHTISADGHSFNDLRHSLNSARVTHGQPTAILAKTIVGKGIHFLEGERSHNMYVTEEVANRARAILQNQSFVEAPDNTQAHDLHLEDFTSTTSTANADVPRYYGESLIAIASQKEEIVCLGADLSVPTESDGFRDKFPDRYFSIGMAEANAVGVASGIAKMGGIPFVHSFSVFLTRRSYDQVAMQIAYPRSNVKLVGFLPGLTTNLGPSHQAIDDLALMRALPNMVVLEPSGPEQYASAVQAIVDYEGPVYLRLRRSEQIAKFRSAADSFNIGGSEILRDGNDVVVFACGIMVEKAMEAANQLSSVGIEVAVVNIYSLKPIDGETVAKFAETAGFIVTAENHTVNGGLGDAVAAELSARQILVHHKKVALNDEFAEGSSTPYLMKKYGLDTADIVMAVKAADL